MDNILIMLSGGVDSTYCLLHYLKTTELPIYTHHIILRSDFQRRYHQETKSTNDVLEWCEKRYPNRIVKNYRSNWWIDQNVSGFDIDLVYFTAANVACNLPGNTAVSTGRNKDDRGLDQMVVSLTIWKTFVKVYEGLVEEPLKPGKDLHKLEVINLLPKDLYELTWSCRSSPTNKPCGRCHACLSNKGVI